VATGGNLQHLSWFRPRQTNQNQRFKPDLNQRAKRPGSTGGLICIKATGVSWLHMIADIANGGQNRPMLKNPYVRWFGNIRLRDIPEVGGKNASLGELHTALAAEGVRVPEGFVLMASAYRDALAETGAERELRRLLSGFDHHDVALLAQRAAAARQLVYQAAGNAHLRAEIAAAYRALEEKCGANVAVAVRSSATAEDLPTASFAGQHESFLNVRGKGDVIEACRRCFASIFTDRAIVYRIDNGFDHFKVALSVGVMKMVRSDLAASGVIFTLDTESGFRDVVFVTGACGLGENVVQGKVDPDEFYVHKMVYRGGCGSRLD